MMNFHRPRKIGIRVHGSLVRLGLVAVSIAISTLAVAQTVDMVTAPVNSASRAALIDQHIAWAVPERDSGVADPNLPLEHLTVVLKRSDQQQHAFAELLREQQDPTSANYHHWLNPVEIGVQFGPSQHDLNAVSAWLEGQGLRVGVVANSRMRIAFSGTAGTVGSAFAVALHRYAIGGETRVAPAGEPTIPAALLGVVQTVRGLHTLRNRVHHRLSVRQSLPSIRSAKPEDTYCQNGSCTYDIFPADFATIYGINPVSQQGIDGSGQDIAIVGRSRVYNADIENFQNIAGLTKKDPAVIVPPEGIDPGSPQTSCSNSSTCAEPNDQSEATLDVERATSVAPGAMIDLVVSADTATDDGSDIATQYVIDTNPVIAHILSISFGICEGYGNTTASDAAVVDEQFSQAAAEGISVFVSSGDTGAAGCDSGIGVPPSTQQLSANLICASGYVTCVGGTEFADTANPAAYWAANDSNNYESAIGYIPEGAWNEPLDSNGKPRAAASGGGVSQFLPTPSWQKGPGVPGTQGRYTPDVALSASQREPYFACMAASGGSCAVTNGGFNYVAAGGTSAGTPSMAGIAALLNQKTGSVQGNLNPRLYALAATPGDGVFHDVTLSSSGVSGCELSIPSMCNNSTPGSSGLSGGLQGYSVATGYDEATGLGSINVTNLLALWNPNASSSVNLDQHGLTGSWFNPATGGQGFEIEVYPDVSGPGQGSMFAGWFTYDITVAGGRRWYGLTGGVSAASPNTTLQIFAVEGGNFSAPPAVGAQGALGQATIQFSDCNTGTLTYTFTDGSNRSGTIPLKRLTPNVTCSASGDNGSAPTDYLLSGNWFNPSTSGQGFIFDMSPSIHNLFAAWYTFIPDGQQIGGPASQSWFTLQSGQFVDGSTSLANIPIIESSGGIFDNPAPATSSQVGTASIVFQSCNAMTLSYQFTGGQNNGVAGTIDLQRVGPTPVGCTL